MGGIVVEVGARRHLGECGEMGHGRQGGRAGGGSKLDLKRFEGVDGETRVVVEGRGGARGCC